MHIWDDLSRQHRSEDVSVKSAGMGASLHGKSDSVYISLWLITN